MTKIEPAHDRGFDEVKDRVERDGARKRSPRRFARQGRRCVKALDGGTTLASLAEADKLEVKIGGRIHRRGGGDLPATVVAAVFASTRRQAGSAATPDGRVVFK